MNFPFLVQHFLEYSARRLPDKVALIYGDERLTYREINEKSNQLAHCMIEMGIQRQDRVAILLDNSVESVIALFGVLKAGAIFMTLSATMKSKKLSYILRDSGAKALITHHNKARIVKHALDSAEDLQNIIWCTLKDVDKVPTSKKQKITNKAWKDIISEAPGFPASQPPVSVIDLDLATIIYTSGSTGEPKGVMSAHYSVISAARSITTYLGNVQEDIILCVLPLSFDYGLYQILMGFMFGGTVILEKSFIFPYKILEKMVIERVTGFPIVPTMAALLFQMENLSPFDFSALRYLSNTAAALPVTYIRKLQSIFPQAKLFSMYGLTECKRVAYLPPEFLDGRPESVGIPMPNEEVFIVNDKGEELAAGEIGELVVRGSNVMQGYWKAPEETARAFRPGRSKNERILYTGDLFKKDEDGLLYFVARKDDMIKTKGERVSPKEIENCICELIGVATAAVIGVPDDIFGQAIKVFVVTDQRHEMHEDTVLKHCQKNLEVFMVPKYVEFREDLPKTSSGKIDKKRLS